MGVICTKALQTASKVEEQGRSDHCAINALRSREAMLLQTFKRLQSVEDT